MGARTSTDVTSLIGARPKGSRLQSTVSGYVSVEQPAPAGFNDPVYVVIPSHNPEGSTQIAAGNWGALQGATLPQAGNACLVAYDENSTPYLVWWSGTYSAGTLGGDLSGTLPNPEVVTALNGRHLATVSAGSAVTLTWGVFTTGSGVIDSAGSGDWSLSGLSTGLATITYPTRSATPAVLLSIGSAANLAAVCSPGASSAAVTTFVTSTLVNQDSIVSFLVFG